MAINGFESARLTLTRIAIKELAHVSELQAVNKDNYANTYEKLWEKTLEKLQDSEEPE